MWLPQRLAETCAQQQLPRELRDEITDLHGRFLGWIVRSADADALEGRTPGPVLEREDLSEKALAELEEGLTQAASLPDRALALLDPQLARAIGEAGKESE